MLEAVDGVEELLTCSSFFNRRPDEHVPGLGDRPTTCDDRETTVGARAKDYSDLLAGCAKEAAYDTKVHLQTDELKR